LYGGFGCGAVFGGDGVDTLRFGHASL